MFGEAKFQWRYSRTVIEITRQQVLSSAFYPAANTYNYFSKTTQRTFTSYKSIIKELDKGGKFPSNVMSVSTRMAALLPLLPTLN